jgi:TPR repeat protein
MTNKDKTKAELVRSPSGVPSQSGLESLARRGMQDLLVREDADQWYQKGLDLRAQEQREQDQTGARLVCSEDELDLLDREGYKAAFACFERGIALNPNHTGLQYYLGVCYFLGEGVPRDDNEAAFWWNKAADQGIAAAQSGLGWICERVLKDYSQAAAWYRKAAENGDEDAQQALEQVLKRGST